LDSDIAANTTISTSTNATGTLLDYSGASFTNDMELHINGVLMRCGSSSGADYDVYAAGTAATGDFACEFNLKQGDVIQQFIGGGSAGSQIVTVGYSSRVYGTATAGNWRGPTAGNPLGAPWNTAHGTGATPTIFSYDGYFPAPADGTVSHVELWVRPGTATTDMDCALYKGQVTDGSATVTPVLLGSSTQSGGSAGPTYDVSFSPDAAIEKGDQLALLFQENNTGDASNMYFRCSITLELD